MGSYGQNRSFKKKGDLRGAGVVRTELPEVSLDESKLALCRKVFGDESVLAHVFHGQKDGDPGWVVKDKAGVELLRFSRIELDESGEERFDYVVNKVAELFCAECTERLLDGEVRVCGPCEAKQVMELLRMREELT